MKPKQTLKQRKALRLTVAERVDRAWLEGRDAGRDIDFTDVHIASYNVGYNAGYTAGYNQEQRGVPSWRDRVAGWLWPFR